MNFTCDETFLVGRTFSFGFREVEPWTKKLQLNADRRIIGYDHPNERCWRLADGALCFMDGNNNVTSLFDDVRVIDNVLIISGKSVIEPTSERNLVLIEAPETTQFAQLVAEECIWESEHPFAVFVRAHAWDEKADDLIKKLNDSPRHFDIFALVDETAQAINVSSGISTIRFTESLARKLGFNQIKSPLFYDCGDIAFYFALRQRPAYQFYVFLDYDVEFLDRDGSLLSDLIASPDFPDADFVGLCVGDLDPSTSWGPASARRFTARFCSYSYFPFVGLSKRALSFMYSQRQVEAASRVAPEDIVQCESFTPSSLRAGGFSCVDLNALVPNAYRWDTMAMQLAANGVGIPMTYKTAAPIDIRMIHPVYSAKEYLDRVAKKFLVIRNGDYDGLFAELNSEAASSLPTEMLEKFRSEMEEECRQ